MKKLLKPACLLLYLLAILSFFILGLLYAGWTDAGKNQGLAGGAIVLGYGVVSAFFGLVISFFVAYYVKHRIILRTNIILTLFLAIGIALIIYNARQRKKLREADRTPIEHQKPTNPVGQERLLALAPMSKKNPKAGIDKMGLGFFKPNFFDKPTLHFYGRPNLEKSLNEHPPIAKLRVVQNELGNYEIAEAPPWFVPIHLKLDYGILYFTVLSISDDFLEVVGNEQTGRSVFLNRSDGQMVFWPDFLLRIGSVEFLDDSNQRVKIKPLAHSDDVDIAFAFMKPIQVKQEWIKVKLMGDDYSEKGVGWIRWKEEGRLLVSYSLLS